MISREICLPMPEFMDGREPSESCPHCELYTCNCTCRFCDALNADGTPCEDLAYDDYDCCPKHQLEAAIEDGDMELVVKWEVICE